MQVDFNAQIVRKPQPKPMPAVGSPSGGSVRSMLDRANAAMVEYRARVANLQSRLSELEGRACTTPSERESELANDLAASIADANAARREIVKLNDRIRGLEADKAILADSAKTAKDEVVRLEDEVAELKASIGADNAELDKRIADLEAENGDLRTENMKLSANLNKAVEKLRRRNKKQGQEEDATPPAEEAAPDAPAEEPEQAQEG